MAVERCPLDQADLYYPTDHLGRVYARCSRCGRDWTHVQLTAITPPQPVGPNGRTVRPLAKVVRRGESKHERARAAEAYCRARLQGRAPMRLDEVVRGGTLASSAVYHALRRLIKAGEVQVTKVRNDNGLGHGFHCVYTLTRAAH